VSTLQGALGLLACIVLAGVASIALRQDSSWDLMNYHYYNAWAFVHGRHGVDWAPAQLQSFHSPFLDLPFYAMVAADLPPRVIAFVLAIPTGVAWYCFARIVATLFAPLDGAVSPKGRPEGEPAPERASAKGSPVSPKGRPEGEPAPERASAEGSPVSPKGRPEGEPAPERVSAKGSPVSPKGRPEGEHASERASAEGNPASPKGRPAILAALAIGITAPMSVSLIGTTMNDWYVATLVLGALWLVVRTPAPTMTTLAAAALLVGLGAGLKLTGSIYAVGFVTALAVTGDGGWPARLRRSAIAAGCVALGLAVAAGPWMVLMAERFGNPLFPYYNDVFRSPWADPVSFSATRFGPQSWLEWLGFPFVMLWKLEGFVAEPEFRDVRPALLYVLAIAALLWRRPAAVAADSRWRFLAAFFVASLAAWAVTYRIFRYLVPLELLAGAFIALLIVRLVPSRRAALALASACVLVVVTSKYPTWWRQRFADHFLTVELPAVDANALVLLVAAEPMSYVLPSFPPDARFAGLVSSFNDPWRRNRLQETIAAAVREHRGPLYSLAMPPGKRVGDDALAAVGLARTTCEEIRTNLRASPLELCRLRRT